MNAFSTLPVDRRAERTHLLLGATLSFGRASTPVRVRNLSATGALVESDDVPPVGTQIVLRRGVLEARGSVAWAGSGKAGLTFGEPLAVSCWLPVKDAKQGVRRDQSSADGGRKSSEGALSGAALVSELSEVQAQLGQLGQQLTLVAMPANAQMLVAAEQRIARVITALLAAQNNPASTATCFHF